MAVEGFTWEIHPVNNLTQASSDPAALRPGHVCAARRQRFSFHVFQQQIPENIGILDHALGVQPRRRDAQLFCPPQAESFREEIVFSADLRFLRRKDFNDKTAGTKYRVGTGRAGINPCEIKPVASENFLDERRKSGFILKDSGPVLYIFDVMIEKHG